MTRKVFIERALRQIYGGQPTADSNITIGLVNSWLSDGLGLAAKKNYTDNFQLDSVGFVNNSFYSTFKGIPITKDENFLYKFLFPSIPLGIGSSEGISRVVFKDANNNLSYPALLLSENELSIERSARKIPNKLLCYSEGNFGYVITTIPMQTYTVSVTMVSGGDSTDLNSELNIPPDYVNIVVEYIKSQLLLERKQMPDLQNDGRDN